jgi:hypothetical protein
MHEMRCKSSTDNKPSEAIKTLLNVRPEENDLITQPNHMTGDASQLNFMTSQT